MYPCRTGCNPEYPTLAPTLFQSVVSAEDQDTNVHMFCEYLCPVLPPTELNDQGKIARMVRMMPLDPNQL